MSLRGAETDELVVGLDASTTACKAVVVDRAGRVWSEGRASYALDNPAPDGWEQDATAWTQAAIGALRQATLALGDRVGAVRAVAVAAQRETFAVVDAAGTPLSPALVWMDARATREVEEVTASIPAEVILARTGKVPCTTPSLYKIRWLLGRARPELARPTSRVVDVHGHLVQALTGAFVTSTASADPTGLVDLHKGDWDDELLAAAHLTRAQVPALAQPGTRLGSLLEEVASATGLPSGTAVIAGAGDGQAAGLGAGAMTGGRLYLNVGTAIVAGVAVTKPQVGRAYRTLIGPAPGTWFLETDLLGGTFSLDWLARLVGGPKEDTLATLEQAAASLPAGAAGLVFLPYLAGVMNPHWDAAASGAFLGLRGDHGAGHLLRAVIEGLALETASQVAELEAAAGGEREVRAVGGSMRRALIAGIFADVMGRAMQRTEAAETTALGAACLAASGVGWFTDPIAAATAMCRTGERVEPGPARERYALLRREVFDGLYATLAPRLRTLARLRAG